VSRNQQRGNEAKPKPGQVIRLSRFFYAERSGRSAKPRRKQFPDGSAIITYSGGTQAILETKLAKPSALREAKPANYRTPLARRSIS
jgi:hypothetical protein